MSPSARVDFERPPVNEVVCGAMFKRVEAFRTSHFGSLWSRFEEEFPKTEDAAPLLRPGGAPLTVDALERRVWFLSQDERYLIQVQRDRFHFNWRRLADEDVYPRFEAVYAAFTRHFDTFRAFVEPLGALELEQLELSYINIASLPSAGYAGMGSVLPDLPWRNHSFLREPDAFQWVAEGPAPLGEGARLRVVAQTASRKTDSSPVLSLELTVRGAPDAASSFELWFEAAHQSIVRGFVELTSREAHQTWRKQG